MLQFHLLFHAVISKHSHSMSDNYFHKTYYRMTLPVDFTVATVNTLIYD